MSDLRDLPDEELLRRLDPLRDVYAAGEELLRRLADLRAERDEAIAERDEAYEDSRRSLDRVNRLVADKTGGIDPYTADDYLAHRLHVESEGRKAAVSQPDSLIAAMERIGALNVNDYKSPDHYQQDVQIITRAALAKAKGEE